MDIIEYLIKEKRCDPICTDENNETPLHWAAENSQYDVTKHFVETLNVLQTFTNSANKTPLDLARDCGHTNVVQ